MFKRLISSLLLSSLFLSALHVVGQTIPECSAVNPAICPSNACTNGNELCNPGFELEDIGWCLHTGYGSGVGVNSGIVSPGYNSSKALKLVATMGPPELFFSLPQPPPLPLENRTYYATDAIYLQDGFESSKFTGIISGGFCSVRHCYNFTKGKTYKGTVWLKSDNQVVVEFLFRRGAPYYEAYAANRITVSSEWDQYSIVGGFDQNVNGSLEINILTPGTLYVDNADISDQIHDEKLNQLLPAGAIPPHFFGLHINKFFGPGTARPPIGFGLLRLWGTVTHWRDLEPSDNNWSWERMDGLVQLAKSDASTEVLYTLGITPQWAAKYPGPGPQQDFYGWGSTSAPRNIVDWADYVTNVVNHDPPGPLPRGSIKYYELWNEVDHGGFWSGGIDKMLELQESTWNIIHPPQDSIDDYLLSPDVTNNGLRWLEEYLEKDGGETVDIFAFHYYPESMMEDGIPYLEAVKSVLRKWGYCCESDPGPCPKCKPIWNTEGAISISIETGPKPAPLTPEEQRAAVSRSYIVQWAFGIENFSWYMWENEGSVSNISLSQPAPYAEAAPAGEAYLTTRNWLVGSTMVSKIINGTVWKIKIIKENGDPAWIVWDTAGDNSIGPLENWTKTQVTPLTGVPDPVKKTASIPIGIEPVLLEDASGSSPGGRVSQSKPESEESETSDQKHEATLHLFPNPSSYVVNIQYQVPEDTHVTITIYNSFGHKVSSLVNEYRLAGTHSTVFRSDKSSSGMFLCEYKTTSSRIVSKIILIR